MSEQSTTEKIPFLEARRRELEKERDEILKVVQPAREFYEQHMNDTKLLEARKIIKETNLKLAPIQQELAGLARALGAKSLQIEQGSYTKEKEES